MAEYLLEMNHITKMFLGTKPLDDVSFNLKAGEIHAIVGENGAGKSTFIKVLTGVHQPDGGEIFLDGKKVEMTTPIVAEKYGVAAIYQHPASYPDLSVAENIYIGHKFKTDSKYANIEYVGVVYGDDDYTKSYDVMKALIDQYPDLKGVIVPTTNGAPAVAKCIIDEGKDATLKMTGLTLAHDMAEYIHGGVAPATFLWNPIELGYVSSYVAVAAVKGEFKFEAGQTIEVPGFEGLTVEVSDDGGLILYLNKLNKFDDSTVDDWIDAL